jgi:hypothetical protein
MRIGSRDVLFIRQNRCPEFDLCKEPLPGGVKCFALSPEITLSGAGNSICPNYDLGEGDG